MLWWRLPKRMLVFALLVTLIFAGAYFIILGRGSNLYLKEQASQESTVARAEATNISSFFDLFGNSIALLAQSDGVKEGGSAATSVMARFVSQWRKSGVIGGVILTDKNGVIVENRNVTNKPDVGKSLADRDYFTWAQSQTKGGAYFIGKAVVSRVGATEGKAVVVVASPVIRNGEFAGVLGASISLNPLVDHYLGLMKVSDDTNVYLIGKDGDLLYDNTTQSVGSSIYDLSSSTSFLGSPDVTRTLLGAIDSTKSGQFQEDDNKIIYAPVQLVNKNWMVVMSFHSEALTGGADSLFIRQVSVLILLYLSIVLFGEIVIQQTLGSSKGRK